MIQIIDFAIPIEEIDDKTPEYTYDDGTIVFALCKDTCQRIVIKLK